MDEMEFVAKAKIMNILERARENQGVELSPERRNVDMMKDLHRTVKREQSSFTNHASFDDENATSSLQHRIHANLTHLSCQNTKTMKNNVDMPYPNHHMMSSIVTSIATEVFAKVQQMMTNGEPIMSIKQVAQPHATNRNVPPPQVYHSEILQAPMDMTAPSRIVYIYIPSDTVTFLIGKKGKHIENIREKSKCQLSVRDKHPNATEDACVLRITGTAANITTAERLIVERIRRERASKNDPFYVAISHHTLLPLEHEEEHDEGKKSKKWLLKCEDVGKIIGKGGSTIKAISRDTGTTLHICTLQEMPVGSTERRIKVTGNPRNVEAALCIIEQKAGGRPDKEEDSRFGRYFSIPFYSASYIIGEKGARIRDITLKSGARIQISLHEDIPLGSINRTVHIQGTSSQIERACTLLAAAIKDLVPHRNKEEDEICLKLLLPTNVCSHLLNKKGVLIRNIMQITGCYAKFQPPLDDSSRVCVLIGNWKSIYDAQASILDLMSAEETKLASKKRDRDNSLEFQEVKSFRSLPVRINRSVQLHHRGDRKSHLDLRDSTVRHKR